MGSACRLRAGCNEPLLILARPPPTALDTRDDFNRMLRHRTIPNVCTRTSNVRINLARRPSPDAYAAPYPTRPHHRGSNSCIGTVGKRLVLGVCISGQTGSRYPSSAVTITIATTQAAKMKTAEILQAIPMSPRSSGFLNDRISIISCQHLLAPLSKKPLR